MSELLSHVSQQLLESKVEESSLNESNEKKQEKEQEKEQEQEQEQKVEEEFVYLETEETKKLEMKALETETEEEESESESSENANDAEDEKEPEKKEYVIEEHEDDHGREYLVVNGVTYYREEDSWNVPYAVQLSFTLIMVINLINFVSAVGTVYGCNL